MTEPRMKSPVILQERNEDEVFEKPGGMGEMPFRRADVSHGLDHIVLGGKWRAQGHTLGADCPVPLAWQGGGDFVAELWVRFQCQGHTVILDSSVADSKTFARRSGTPPDDLSNP